MKRVLIGSNEAGTTGDPGRRLVLRESSSFSLGTRHLTPFVGRAPELPSTCPTITGTTSSAATTDGPVAWLRRWRSEAFRLP